MEIKTVSTLFDDRGKEITEGEMLALTVGKKNLVAKYSGIASKGTLRFTNPITAETFNVRLSSIQSAKRCTFKMD